MTYWTEFIQFIKGLNMAKDSYLEFEDDWEEEYDDIGEEIDFEDQRSYDRYSNISRDYDDDELLND